MWWSNRRPRALTPTLTLTLAALSTLSACGSSISNTASTTSQPTTSQPTAPAAAEVVATTTDEAEAQAKFPDVIGATAQETADGVWEFSATVSSPYDSAERYADAWRVVGTDGTVYGVRELLHDHASEQPFTRSVSGIEIPESETAVTVEGRDQISGWGGETVTITLER